MALFSINVAWLAISLPFFASFCIGFIPYRIRLGVVKPSYQILHSLVKAKDLYDGEKRLGATANQKLLKDYILYTWLTGTVQRTLKQLYDENKVEH